MNAATVSQDERESWITDLPPRFMQAYNDLVHEVIQGQPIQQLVKYVTFSIQLHEDDEYSVEMTGVYDGFGRKINEQSLECFSRFDDLLFDMMWDLIDAVPNVEDSEWQIIVN